MTAAAAAPTTPSRSRGPILPRPAALPPPPKRAETDQAALTELRNASATYDFLRRKGDPAEFWEMLRLARSRRVIVAPAEGEAPVPAPEVEASIVHELDAIRRQFGPLVRSLRTYLKNIPGLPEPSDRLEMALAFLLASAREHQAIAKWLAEPSRHEAKAVEKLRSLAAITDPYREALQPWSLSAAAEPLEATFAEIEPPAPPSPPAVDSGLLETVRRGIECREILVSIHLDADLWETVLVAATLPQTARTVVERLSTPLEGDLLQQAQADGLAIEALHQATSDLRGRYGGWVRSFRMFLSERTLAPDDQRMFEVGLALMLATPAARGRLGAWLEDPATWQEEVVGLLSPWMRRAQDVLAALK